MTHAATKIVIITEQVIFNGVIKIIEAEGASGYTAVAAGGKGSRGVRQSGREAAVADAFTNVKIEVITSDRAKAVRIAEAVAARYFENYSGITYLESVEILRPGKF